MLLNRWLHNIAECYIIHNTNTKYFESMICKRTIQYLERHAVVFQTRNMNIWSNADMDDWYEIQLGPMNEYRRFKNWVLKTDRSFRYNIFHSFLTCYVEKNSFVSVIKLQIRLHTSCHADWDYCLALAFYILPSLHRL